MTYSYRREERDAPVEYAPYVMREPAPDLSKCGTTQGYQQHLYYGQETCPACKAAWVKRGARQRAGRGRKC